MSKARVAFQIERDFLGRFDQVVGQGNRSKAIREGMALVMTMYAARGAVARQAGIHPDEVSRDAVRTEVRKMKMREERQNEASEL